VLFAIVIEAKSNPAIGFLVGASVIFSAKSIFTIVCGVITDFVVCPIEPAIPTNITRNKTHDKTELTTNASRVAKKILKNFITYIF
jgi:hypothetical protein